MGDLTERLRKLGICKESFIMFAAGGWSFTSRFQGGGLPTWPPGMDQRLDSSCRTMWHTSWTVPVNVHQVKFESVVWSSYTYILCMELLQVCMFVYQMKTVKEGLVLNLQVFVVS